jgi:hypothetical protein
MLDQEKQIEAAKAEGKPIPKFPPLLSTRAANGAVLPAVQANVESLERNRIKVEHLKPKIQAELKKRLEGLTDEERELEEKTIKAEIQLGEQTKERLSGLWQSQAEERQKRKEQGKETFGDRITALLKFT